MDKENIIKIIWWILILFTAIFLIASIYIHYETSFYNKINLHNLDNICETGDLILFRWRYVDVGFRLFSKFCHAGIVYKDKNNNLFIIETHPEEFEDNDKETEPKKGVNIYPLKSRLQEYDGSCYLSKLIHYPNLNINKNIIQTKINDYKKIPFDDNFRNNFVKFWFFDRLGLKKSKRNVMYCSEFIAHILKDLNVINNDIDASSFSPTTFLNLKNKINKKAYGEIHTIITH